MQLDVWLKWEKKTVIPLILPFLPALIFSVYCEVVIAIFGGALFKDESLSCVNFIKVKIEKKLYAPSFFQEYYQKYRYFFVCRKLLEIYVHTCISLTQRF